MKNKVFTICVWIVLVVILATGCGTQEQQPTTEEITREIDVWLDGYELAGGRLFVMEVDMDGGRVESEYGSIGMLGAEGETIGDVMAYWDYTDVTPVLEGDVFEGWMECVYDEDEGIYVVFPETLYSTEDLLALTVPDHSVTYVAKWQGIPAEEYFVVEGWDDAGSSGGFAFTGNGGSITFREADGSEYASPAYAYWLEDGQTLNDIMGTEYGAALIGVEKEGCQFAGWTLYKADDMFWNGEAVQEDDMLCLLFNEDDTWGTTYVLLRNAVVVDENMSTEQLREIICMGENYLAVANWD